MAPATGLRKPKSPKEPGECWEECREKGTAGWTAGSSAVFSAFPKKPASQHCSQQSPQQSPFSRHSSQHSPRHFWGCWLSQSCSRCLGFVRVKRPFEELSQSSRAFSEKRSRSSENKSRNAKFHSRNGISRLEQYENHNSRSNSGAILGIDGNPH